MNASTTAVVMLAALVVSWKVGDKVVASKWFNKK